MTVPTRPLTTTAARKSARMTAAKATPALLAAVSLAARALNPAAIAGETALDRGPPPGFRLLFMLELFG
jgi:hypothetical protein